MDDLPFWFHPEANAEVLAAHHRYFDASFEQKLADLLFGEFVWWRAKLVCELADGIEVGLNRLWLL